MCLIINYNIFYSSGRRGISDGRNANKYSHRTNQNFNSTMSPDTSTFSSETSDFDDDVDDDDFLERDDDDGEQNDDDDDDDDVSIYCLIQYIIHLNSYYFSWSVPLILTILNVKKQLNFILKTISHSNS